MVNRRQGHLAGSELVFEITKIASDGELTLNAPNTSSIASAWIPPPRNSWTSHESPVRSPSKPEKPEIRFH
jgi:hypothetical protein